MAEALAGGRYTTGLVSGYVLGIVTLAVLSVVFGRGLTTGIVFLSLLLAAGGLAVAWAAN